MLASVFAHSRCAVLLALAVGAAGAARAADHADFTALSYGNSDPDPDVAADGSTISGTAVCTWPSGCSCVPFYVGPNPWDWGYCEVAMKWVEGAGSYVAMPDPAEFVADTLLEIPGLESFTYYGGEAAAISGDGSVVVGRLWMSYNPSCCTSFREFNPGYRQDSTGYETFPSHQSHPCASYLSTYWLCEITDVSTDGSHHLETTGSARRT